MREVAVGNQVIWREWGAWFFTRRVILPGVGYVFLAIVGTTVITRQDQWLSALGGLQLLFLFTGTYNAWSLLTRVDKSQQ